MQPRRVGMAGAARTPARGPRTASLRCRRAVTMTTRLPEAREVALLELLDRVIDQGVVIAGDITISVADVDLIYLGLRVMLTSVERAQELRRGQARREARA